MNPFSKKEGSPYRGADPLSINLLNNYGLIVSNNRRVEMLRITSLFAFVFLLFFVSCAGPSRPSSPTHNTTASNDAGAAAYSHYKKGAYDKAIEGFSKAISLNPSDSRNFFYRGAAFGDKGESDQAIKDFSEVIRLEPGMASAWYNRAFNYKKIGDYNKASKTTASI